MVAVVSLPFGALAAAPAGAAHPSFEPATEAAAPSVEPCVCLHVLLRVRIPAETLIGVQAEIERIWRLSGVRIVYRGDNGLCPERAGRAIVVYVAHAPEDFVNPPRVPPSALGAAVVYAFVARVTRKLEEGPAVESAVRRLVTLLGRVIAHEVGHVLLGSGTHAPSGLMRDRFTGWDSTERPDAAFRLTVHEQATVHRRLMESASATPVALLARAQTPR